MSMNETLKLSDTNDAFRPTESIESRAMCNLINLSRYIGTYCQRDVVQNIFVTNSPLM